MNFKTLSISLAISGIATLISYLLKWYVDKRRLESLYIDRTIESFRRPNSVTLGFSTAETLRALQRLSGAELRDQAIDVRRLHERPVAANCRNCGAAPEPVCSYCGTQSEAFASMAEYCRPLREAKGLVKPPEPPSSDDRPSIGIRMATF